MSSDDLEEPTWFVKGIIRYVTEGHSEEDEGAIFNNIIAPDQRGAADEALKSFHTMLVSKGKLVSALAWVADPEVSPFNPYIDR